MWEKLNEEQKRKFKRFCDEKFGVTQVFSPNGQPLYIDENLYLINTEPLIELLFNVCLN